MNDLSSKFSLYEALRILIPGSLVVCNLRIAKEILKIDFFLDSVQSSYQIFFFFLAVFIIGLIIYSLDIPKRINFFQKDLPSKKILERHPKLEKATISNSYFTFYDKLSAELKKKTETYSGFYHFLINISFSSLCCSVFFAITEFKTLKGLTIFNIGICVVCFIVAIILYYSRLRFAFQRHLKLYYKSDEYKELVKDA